MDLLGDLMIAAFIILLCTFSGFFGYQIGTEDCKEYLASRQLEQAQQHIAELEDALADRAN